MDNSDADRAARGNPSAILQRTRKLEGILDVFCPSSLNSPKRNRIPIYLGRYKTRERYSEGWAVVKLRMVNQSEPKHRKWTPEITGTIDRETHMSMVYLHYILGLR